MNRSGGSGSGSSQATWCPLVAEEVYLCVLCHFMVHPPQTEQATNHPLPPRRSAHRIAAWLLRTLKAMSLIAHFAGLFVPVIDPTTLSSLEQLASTEGGGQFKSGPSIDAARLYRKFRIVLAGTGEAYSVLSRVGKAV
jgi:hypothetical protein